MEQLQKQIQETEVLLRRKKAEVAQMSAAGASVSAVELGAILKLELQLANMRSFMRLWEQTREG